MSNIVMRKVMFEAKPEPEFEFLREEHQRRERERIRAVIQESIAHENADINQNITPNGEKLIHLAIKIALYDEHGSLNLLLNDIRCNVDSIDSFGSTALHYAIDNDDLKSVELLLDHSAQIDIRNNRGVNAADYAYAHAQRTQKYEIFKQVISQGASIDRNLKTEDNEIASICKSVHFADDIYLSRIIPSRMQYMQHIRHADLIYDRISYFQKHSDLYGKPRDPEVLHLTLNILSNLADLPKIQDMVEEKLADDESFINQDIDESGQKLIHLATTIYPNDDKFSLELLLNDNRCNINEVDNYGLTALHYAVANNDLESVELLIDYNAKIDIKNSKGRTLVDCAFHYALQTHKYEIFQFIIARGIPVNKNINVSDSSITAIIKAADLADDIYFNRRVPAETEYKEYAKYASLIIDRINYYTDNKAVYGLPHSPELNKVALNKLSVLEKMPMIQEEVEKMLVDKNSNINQGVNKLGQTLLHHATMIAQYDEKSSLESLLMDNRCNVNISDNDGFTALQYALVNEDIKSIKLLLAKNAQINTKVEAMYTKNSANEKISSIIKAASFADDIYFKGSMPTELEYREYVQHADLIIERLTSYNDREDIYGTAKSIEALRVAITNLSRLAKHDAILCFVDIKLSDKNNDINQNIDANGEKLIHLAATIATYDDMNSLKILIDEDNCDVNITDNEDRTALHYAIINNDIDTTKLLLDCGAQIDVKDSRGFTIVDYAFHYAKSDQDLDILKLLMTYGAPLNKTMNIVNDEIVSVLKAASFADDIYLNRVVPTKAQYREHARHADLIRDRVFYYTENLTIYGEARSQELVRNALTALKNVEVPQSWVALMQINSLYISCFRIV